MGIGAAIAVSQTGLVTALLVAAPILAVVLLLGLIVSLLQAVTGLQEPTLSFVPKLIGVAAVLFILGPWMLLQLAGFGADLISHMGVILGQ